MNALTHTILRTASVSLLAGLMAASAMAADRKAAAKTAAPASVAAAAAAAPQLKLASSELTFQVKQMGVPVEGKFKRFEADVKWNAKALDQSSVAFTIDLTSATMGQPMIDSELGKPTWLDSKRTGSASFKSQQVKALSGNQFEVTGTLTLKGVAQVLKFPITVAAGPAGTSVVSGQVQIKRQDFRIGDGEWNDPSMVSSEVGVRFKLAFTGLVL